MIGTVTSVHLEKGYGFITSAEYPRGVFFHVKQVSGMPFDETLRERRVEFDVEENARGLRATYVCPSG